MKVGICCKKIAKLKLAFFAKRNKAKLKLAIFHQKEQSKDDKLAYFGLNSHSTVEDHKIKLYYLKLP